MLNKFGRKRITIVVGKRKPTLSEEVDGMVTISVTKTNNPTYYEVRTPKQRPEGKAYRFEYARGQTPPVHTFEESPFVEEPIVKGTD